MTEAEKRLKQIESMAELSVVDCPIAQVRALCEIARAVNRLGDLYLTDLIFQNRIPANEEQFEIEGPDYRTPSEKAARTFLRRVYDDARSK